ncbi:hypothetical protein DFP73DRAFT_373887 [Morchella snyderi]|nr:hypothetical protein DFP73DRAFT_373887 [Morchella snyderi]
MSSTSSLTSNFMGTITSALTTPTTTPTPINNNGGGGGGGGGPTNSPLLFFVALGFGVVFTNLWIIVGVKYCFRYNARQRARANGEEEPVDLQTMPRPHRRRREKKLMTTDEVNERFPSLKYKTWRAHRERMGLPSEGGIKTAPNSRPVSVKQIEAAISPAEGTSTQSANANPALLKEVLASAEAAPPVPPALIKEQSAGSSILPHADTSADENKRLSEISDVDPKHNTDDIEEDDDHHVNSELLNNVGDACAICLDTIDDDDEIRGLTCGHAFHAQCIDPWLTSRRACCPLCKADYYTPKPRPEGEPNDDSRRSRRQNTEREPIAAPPDAYIGPPFHRRMLFSPGRFMAPYYGSEGRTSRNSDGNGDNRGRNTAPSTSAQNRLEETGDRRSRWLRNPFNGVTFPIIRRSRDEPTPRDLEAGDVAVPSRMVTSSVQGPTPAATPAPLPETH